MGQRAEQTGNLPKWIGRSYKRYIKRITARKARRLAKRLLEDAPPRRTEGWAD